MGLKWGPPTAAGHRKYLDCLLAGGGWAAVSHCLLLVKHGQHRLSGKGRWHRGEGVGWEKGRRRARRPSLREYSNAKVPSLCPRLCQYPSTGSCCGPSPCPLPPPCMTLPGAGPRQLSWDIAASWAGRGWNLLENSWCWGLSQAHPSGSCSLSRPSLRNFPLQQQDTCPEKWGGVPPELMASLSCLFGSCAGHS